jgi:hypothetical protein
MKLTTLEIENYISDIALGKRFVSYKNKQYILKHPSQEESFRARLVYEQCYTEAKEFGLPTHDELEKTIEARNLYTEEDDNKIKEIEEKIKGQRSVLEKTYRVPARRERLVNIIDGLQKELNKIKNKKLVLLQRTCEAKAKEEQYVFLCRTCSYIYDKEWNETRIWKDKDEFELDRDNELKGYLLNEYIRLVNGLESSIIRTLARSNLFIIRYLNSMKTSTPVFNVPSTEYTVDMLSLSYWANWYRSIYEMMPDEIPPDELIDDDEGLDAYMEQIYANRKNEREMSRYESSKGIKKGKSLSAFDHSDVIITSSNPIYNDVEYNHHKRFKKTEKGVDVKEKGQKV